MGYSYNSGNVYGRGDYYRGDPGIFGTIFKTVARGIGGFITGGPAGAVGAVATSLIRRPAQGTALAPLPTPPSLMLPPLQQTGIVNIGPPEKQTGVINIAKGGAGVPGLAGHHLNRTTYETRGGATSRWGPAGTLQIHQAGTVIVKNRRMNVGNARALKHALRRAYGFERLARRVLHITSPRKHVKGFKRPRARK